MAHALNYAFANNNGNFTVNGKIFYYLHRWLTKYDIENRHFRSDEIIHSLRRIMPTGIGSEQWMEHVEKVLNREAINIANGKHLNHILLARKLIQESYPANLWGDKYNEYCNIMPYINHLFPNAKYIFIVRNPIEVANSISKWSVEKYWRPTTLEANYQKWAKWHENLFLEVEKLTDDQYIILNYDKLCKGEYSNILGEFTYLDNSYFHPNLFKRKSKELMIKELPEEINKLWNKIINHCD